MKNIYDMFVDFSLQQCNKDDYNDKLKVKSHNKASKKILQLQMEMSKFDSSEILNILLSHEDDRVRINAAYACSRLGILQDKMMFTLNDIIDNSNDSTIIFSAKMLYKAHEN